MEAWLMCPTYQRQTSAKSLYPENPLSYTFATHEFLVLTESGWSACWRVHCVCGRTGPAREEMPSLTVFHPNHMPGFYCSSPFFMISFLYLNFRTTASCLAIFNIYLSVFTYFLLSIVSSVFLSIFYRTSIFIFFFCRKLFNIHAPSTFHSINISF